MGNGRSKSGLSSDAGSDHTDQSLLVRIVFISLYNVHSKYPQMTSKKVAPITRTSHFWSELCSSHCMICTQNIPKRHPNDFSFQSEEPGERLSPGLLLLPGDSMITLNKFNEDDDDGFFLGGFNEDGSFIGDYMDTDPETNRAVMNRLVGFQQLFSKKC